MEGLTRLVSESLARHGFDRPLDYRRLSWSRWFRCESHHSLLFVPSKPGVFAVAEEIMDLGSNVEERRFSAASSGLSIAALAAATTAPEAESRKPEAGKRMLAVTQFFEDDDMAFVLDRMLSRQNPMSSRLASGRYFVRFVVVEDQTQRRSICSALNQWIVSAAEKVTGIASDFASSLELTSATEYVREPNHAQPSLFPGKEDENVARTPSPTTARSTDAHVATDAFVRPASEASTSITPSPSTLSMTAPQLDSGAATNIHCPSPFPSGF
jgi:hypothetical protein